MKAQNKTIILDTSSWTWLTQVGLINFVFKLTDDIIVPEQIHKETLRGKERGYRDAFYREELVKEGRIRVIEVKKAKITRVMKESGMRNEADASVITLALDKNGFVFTEDPPIFNCCLLYGINSAKTSNLIVFLVEQNLLERKRAREILRMLEIRGYNSNAIIDAIKLLEVI